MMKQHKNKPITYQWKGFNSKGQKVKGMLEAPNLLWAKVMLHQQGICKPAIAKKRPMPFDKKNKKIKQTDITIFTRQLGVLIKSGIPLLHCFDIASKSQNNYNMQKLINHIKKEVESGLTLSDAFAQEPRYFNTLFCNLIAAGEKSGSLEIILAQVTAYRERIETTSKKMKKALTYPTAVFIVAFCVTAGLLLFVIPQFESLFKGFGANLPPLTQAVVNLSHVFQAYCLGILSFFCLAITAVIYAPPRFPIFAQMMDNILLKLPIVGSILQKAAIARFTRTLSTIFAAGLPLIDALDMVSGITGHILYAKTIIKIKEKIAEGIPLQTAIEQAGFFPPMVIQMVAIGEESGTLEQMLSKAADFYEDEMDNALDRLHRLLEPVIMSILGILVGGLVIAMYLPIFKLGAVI